mgnify:CR=1 FL=1
MDFQQASALSYVTLVDRAGTGGTELIYDGVRIVFKPGETEKTVPEFVAEWLFTVTQGHVWTETGEFVNRFAVKDASQQMADILGPEAMDCSPIVLDHSRIEGWDTSSVDRSSHETLTLNVPAREFRERQGTATVAFGGRKG